MRLFCHVEVRLPFLINLINLPRRYAIYEFLFIVHAIKDFAKKICTELSIILPVPRLQNGGIQPAETIICGRIRKHSGPYCTPRNKKCSHANILK